jgi:hypothetical protein
MVDSNVAGASTRVALSSSLSGQNFNGLLLEAMCSLVVSAVYLRRIIRVCSEGCALDVHIFCGISWLLLMIEVLGKYDPNVAHTFNLRLPLSLFSEAEP